VGIQDEGITSEGSNHFRYASSLEVDLRLVVEPGSERSPV